MSNRKRVTLTFEIDDHAGFNDDYFLRSDFLQELSCCVNDPYPDTFVMKIEDAAVPQEMSAREYLKTESRMCKYYGLPSAFDLSGMTVDESIEMIEDFAREHPEEVKDER